MAGAGQTLGLPVARNWATFGAKVSYNPLKEFEIYAGYTYDAFNQYLETHTVTGGLSYTF
jgi:outer membrane autotransporter protein